MKHDSIWLDGLNFSESPFLDQEIEVDVLIIGGGMTGLSTAYQLIDSKLKVALVEANLIGHGVTSKTTGKLTYLQEDIYSKIKKSRGLDASKSYYLVQREAIFEVQRIIQKHQIECNLSSVSSIAFTNDPKKVSSLKKEAELLRSFGATVEEGNRFPNGKECQYFISVSDTYVFHPLKYLKALKEIIEKSKIQIYERTRIESIDYRKGFYFCKTKQAFVKAKKVVLALHYPYFLFPFVMPGRVTLEKSYVGVLSVDKTYPFSAISVDQPIVSLRYHEDVKKYQFFLYGSHNICQKYNEKENFSPLLDKFSFYDYLWSNIDIITGDSLPYIGLIQDQLFLATGYNTWGMTNGSLAGKILKKQLQGMKTSYDDLFSPKRGVSFKNLLYFPVVFGSNIKAFASGIFFRNKSWYDGRVRFEKREDKDVAIYTDTKGVEHVVLAHCPHVHCNLIFNMEELTWDCPCHGSRFDMDGHCIEGPSNRDIGYKEEEK